MVEAKTQLLWLETTKKQDSVEIEAYLKPSWVLASTNIANLLNYLTTDVVRAV